MCHYPTDGGTVILDGVSTEGLNRERAKQSYDG